MTRRRWDAQDTQQILALVKEYGPDRSRMAAALGATVNQINNHIQDIGGPYREAVQAYYDGARTARQPRPFVPTPVPPEPEPEKPKHDPVPHEVEGTTKIQWGGDVLRFGVVSDTHMGSRYAQKATLQSIYDEGVERGINTFLHPGDWFDGEGVYRGHGFELEYRGAEEQLAHGIADYPRRDGVETWGISGNHDWSFFKIAGYDIVNDLAKERPDIHYLGPIGKMLDFTCTSRRTKRFRVHLLHPRGSSAYARSYKLQKIAEGYEGGEKPDMALVGHWHHQCHVFTRNIHMFQVPCVQAQTPFEKEHGLQPVIGCYFFEVEFSRAGDIGRLGQELLTWTVPEEAAPFAGAA